MGTQKEFSKKRRTCSSCYKWISEGNKSVELEHFNQKENEKMKTFMCKLENYFFWGKSIFLKSMGLSITGKNLSLCYGLLMPLNCHIYFFKKKINLNIYGIPTHTWIWLQNSKAPISKRNNLKSSSSKSDHNNSPQTNLQIDQKYSYLNFHVVSIINRLTCQNQIALYKKHPCPFYNTCNP